MYQPSNCTIIIAGKVEQPALDLLAGTFGEGWENRQPRQILRNPK
nr:hypothetical protein [Mucilaginibacter humi]